MIPCSPLGSPSTAVNAACPVVTVDAVGTWSIIVYKTTVQYQTGYSTSVAIPGRSAAFSRFEHAVIDQNN
jgi:recombinational DNA repair protein RecT